MDLYPCSQAVNMFFFFAGRRSMVIQCKVASSAQLGLKKYVMFGVGAVHIYIYMILYNPLYGQPEGAPALHDK